LKEKLYQNKIIDDTLWNKVIGEIDENGDGEIDFEEFERMMKMFLDEELEDESEIVI
jgi:Ca2+-binding EF-hand superfamily protein